MENNQQINRIILAPMEGVLDYYVRELLTQLNDFDYCVTEFLRVTTHKLPNKTFYRLCPELYQQGKTSANTPVRVQLLGQSPQWMAENAYQAIALGSFGVDINCGCPAKTVVNSQGGASLLKSPELIYQIVKQVRSAIPDSILSVKIRLGWDNKTHCNEIADAIEQGGADEIAIHGRTKTDGYQADKIDWQTIGLIKQKRTIPVIANGEIFNHQDAITCINQSQTNDIMLGRGILSLPNLANLIRYRQSPLEWQQVVQLLKQYANTPPNNNKPLYHSSRIKQWLSYLKKQYPQAIELLQLIRPLTTQQQLVEVLNKY